MHIMYKHYIYKGPMIVAGKKLHLDNQLIGCFGNNSVT